MGIKDISRNEWAVTNPAQSIIAFSIVVTMVGFYFAGVNSSFVSYENVDTDISAKAIDIIEKLLGDAGEAIGDNVNWEFDTENLTAIGLCATPTFSNFSNSGLNDRHNVFAASYSGQTEGSKDKNGDLDIEVLFQKPTLWYWDSETQSYKPLWLKNGYTSNNLPDWIKITHNGVLTDEAKKYFSTTPPLPSRPTNRYDLNKVNMDVIFFNIDNSYQYEIKLNNNFLYAILDERKMSNLTNIDYEKAKEALGIDDNYDFSITITGNNGTVLAYDSTNKYFKNGDVGSTSSSNTITVLDQSNTNGAGDEIGSYGQYLAQTFTCGQSGNLKSVELHVRNVKADEDITVKIKAVQNGKPSGDPLATATIPKFSDTSFVWKNATFSNPPSLTEGTQYAIVIEAISSRYAFEKNSNGYSSGEMGTSKDGSKWDMDPSSDLLFKTWMEVEQNNGGGSSMQLPSPPLPPIPPGNAVSTGTRNVLIRHPVPDEDHYIYVYEPAQMTVRIFK
ncbi:MAG: hypothetical protein J7K13_06180 [Thermoplasmata archaeon]|nr:hypothetical protein [Thermoplasmata archaeon]